MALPRAAEHSGTLGWSPQASPPLQGQLPATAQSEQMGLGPSFILHCIKTVRQSPQKLRNYSKVTQTQGCLWFGLTVQFLEPVMPARAPRHSCGVDSSALLGNSRLLLGRPLFCLLLWIRARLLLRNFCCSPCRDFSCLLCRKSLRLLLGDFFSLVVHRLLHLPLIDPPRTCYAEASPCLVEQPSELHRRRTNRTPRSFVFDWSDHHQVRCRLVCGEQ